MNMHYLKILSPVIWLLSPAMVSAQNPMEDTVLEGELIEGIAASSGKVARQSMTMFKQGKWSGDVQVWWSGARVPAELTAPFDVPATGDYAVSLGMTKSYDYGIFTFAIDDHSYGAGPVDLYAQVVTNSAEHSLGTFKLTEGHHRLRIRLEGSNSKSKGTMFGLDFIRLHPVRLTRAQAGIDAILSEHQTSLETQVHAPHLAEVKALDTSYLAALDRAMAAASQAGKLEEAVAIRDEKTRVASGGSLPAGDEGAPAALVPLLATYRTARAKLEAARDLAIEPLVRVSDQKLDALQREMTQAGDLEAAVAVREARKKLTQNIPIAALVSVTSPAAGSAPAAPATDGLVTSPPPAPSRPVSQELTMENLARRRFIFGMVRDRDVRPYSLVVFGPNGRIRGNESSNESAWSVDAAKGAVNIIDDKGRISTHCDKVRWENGLVSLSGEFLLSKSGVVHGFDEVAPVPVDFPPLTERRVKGRRFEFCYVSDRGSGNDHVVQLADDGKVLGARFPTATTWKIDGQARLIFIDALGKPFSLFDRLFTFNKGDHLVLEGPMQKDPTILHRLIELP